MILINQLVFVLYTLILLVDFILFFEGEFEEVEN